MQSRSESYSIAPDGVDRERRMTFLRLSETRGKASMLIARQLYMTGIQRRFSVTRLEIEAYA